MKMQVQTSKSALKQNELVASKKMFFLLRLFAALSKSFDLHHCFPLLSAVMYRPINWKPRLSATRWTPRGTRRSPTVESQRKTCTAKHSGKCLLFLSPSAPASLFCLGHQKAYKGFLIVYLHHSLCTVYRPLSFLCFTLILSPLILWSPSVTSPSFLPVLTSLLSTRIRKDLPSLLQNHPSLFVFLPVFRPCLSLCSSCSDRLRSD